jgi:hypothetical protein
MRGASNGLSNVCPIFFNTKYKTLTNKLFRKGKPTMLIQKPFLRTNGYHWAKQRTIIDNYWAHYNEGRPLREQLRSQHMHVFVRLVLMLEDELRKHNKLFADTPQLAALDNNNWLLLQNRRKQLIGHINKQSKTTIKRLIERLEEAGLVKTVNNEEFEALSGMPGKWNDLLINPELILIYDAQNFDFEPSSPWLTDTEKCGLQKKKHPSCTTVSSNSTLQESIKNEIMPVQNVEKGISHPVDGLLESDGNITLPEATPNLNGNQGENQTKQAGGAQKNTKKTQKTDLEPEQQSNPGRENQGIPNPEPSKADILTERRHLLSLELYNFMVQNLFKTHEIYPAEATRTVHYLGKTYFKPVTSDEQGDWLLKLYKWRVKQAASYIDRKNFDFSNIYPYAYVNINNPKGFTATKAWYEKSVKDTQRKAKARELHKKDLADKQTLHQAIDEYQQNPTLRTFNRITKRLNDSNPHLYEQFIDTVNITI